MCSDRTLKILTHSVWRGSKYKGYIQRHALGACVHTETQRVFKIYSGLATTHHHAWQHSNFGKKSLITSGHQLRPSGLQLYKLHRHHADMIFVKSFTQAYFHNLEIYPKNRRILQHLWSHNIQILAFLLFKLT